MSATLTHRPEAPQSVSDERAAHTPIQTVLWALLVAIVVGSAAAAIVMEVTAPDTFADGSNQFAETQRQLSVAKGAVVDVSSQAAEFQRMASLGRPDTSVHTAENLRFAAIGATVDASAQIAETQRLLSFAPSPVIDVSSYVAETQRMAALASPVDTSVQFAEDQRLAAAITNAGVDTSHDSAEFARMLSLDDTSWEQAEALRQARLAPNGNQ